MVLMAERNKNKIFDYIFKKKNSSEYFSWYDKKAIKENFFDKYEKFKTNHKKQKYFNIPDIKFRSYHLF